MVTTLDFFVSPPQKRRNNRPWDRTGWSKKRKKIWWRTAEIKKICRRTRRAAEMQLVLAIVANDTDDDHPTKEPFTHHTKWGCEGHSSYWL